MLSPPSPVRQGLISPGKEGALLCPACNPAEVRLWNDVFLHHLPIGAALAARTQFPARSPGGHKAPIDGAR